MEHTAAYNTLLIREVSRDRFWKRRPAAYRPLSLNVLFSKQEVSVNVTNVRPNVISDPKLINVERRAFKREKPLD